jgi:CBS domain-containing protein
MLGPDTAVAEIMSRDLITCSAEGDVAEAAALMGERQVRRLLVIDRAGAAVGILSLGDIAEHASEELAGQALGEISEARARDGPKVRR